MSVTSIIKNKPDMNAKAPPTAEQIEQRYKDNAPEDEWYEARDADVANFNGMLEKYKTPEAFIKYGTSRVVAWGKSTLQLKKDIAAVIVGLRKLHTSSAGNFPDWDGRTQAYKYAKRKMLQDSGLPQQDLLAIENAIKYHVQNLVVKIAPRKELETVGMLTTSRRERQNQRQQPASEPEVETPETPASTGITSVVVGGVELPPQEPKGNQVEYLLMVITTQLETILKSKDLVRADKQKIAEQLRVIVEEKIAAINDRLSEAGEKAQKRQQQSAARRAAAAEATEGTANSA